MFANRDARKCLVWSFVMPALGRKLFSAASSVSCATEQDLGKFMSPATSRSGLSRPFVVVGAVSGLDS
jgi:hypothetical protein